MRGLYRGADDGVVLSDRAFAGSDTLATSYALSAAVRKIGDYDLIIGGRRLSDGDTAQVGPQVAEKLGLPQVTYAEEIIKAENGEVLIRRRIESGVETVKAPMPLVVTVNGSAAECRPRNAKESPEIQICRRSFRSCLRRGNAGPHRQASVSPDREWSAETVEADLAQCGLAGSPTKVKGIENVVFAAKDARRVENNDEKSKSSSRN